MGSYALGTNLRVSKMVQNYIFRFKGFLGAFPKNCGKRLLASSCPSVRPSVRTEQLVSHWTDFNEIWYLSTFLKNCRENSSFIKICQEQRALYMKTDIHFQSYPGRDGSASVATRYGLDGSEI
jgi:hypothetical protein